MKERTALEVLAVKGEKYQNMSRSNRVSTYGQDLFISKPENVASCSKHGNILLFIYTICSSNGNLLHAFSYLVSAIIGIDSRSKRTYLGKPGPQILRIKEISKLCVRDKTNADL